MLAEGIRRPELTIAVDTYGFLLCSSFFDQLDSPAKVLAKAFELAESINGYVNLYLGGGSILVGAVIDADGNQTVFPEPAEVRMDVFPPNVVVESPAGSTIVRRPTDPIRDSITALSDPHVRKALRLRGAGDLDWVGLCRLLEVIEDGATEEQKRSWPKKEIKRIKHNASSVAVAGDAARHGKERTDPPSVPMSLKDARLRVDTLLKDWLESIR